ncbi:MAG: LPS export ABC transporter periplasmic protein LptC [Bradyrhizobiaceae bacterium]|nr:LPS export ABC transporter periplasmic protein LptC [Bradyrhizobiaceae bacterium]
MDTAHYTSNTRHKGDRQFRSAKRHSRRVRLLRRVIPAGILALFGVVAFATWFNPLGMLTKLPIDPGKLLVSGTKITMEAPRLAGFTRDARPYEFTARAAAQDITKPDVLELKDIHAKIEMQDKAHVEMTAASGIYDTKSEVLKLTDPIQLSSSAGYSGRLSDAIVDVRKGDVITNHPVEVILLNGTLNANRLEVVNNGELLRFDGGVAMNMMLNQSDSAAATNPQGAPP